MDYFHIPRTDGMPDWSKIPALPLSNRFLGKNKKVTSSRDDLTASFKLAWDPDHLYLHVEAEDNHFVPTPELWKRSTADQSLYVHDGCLEVYFDTGADGRTNAQRGFDTNDYRYDFSIGKDGKSGPGMVYRLREVDLQLADGVNMPTKEEAARKIRCDFTRTGNRYSYTIVFDKRYLEPMTLEEGFTCGFGLYLHDRDNAQSRGCPKGLSLATEPGEHCDLKPHLWPLMVLSGEKADMQKHKTTND